MVLSKQKIDVHLNMEHHIQIKGNSYYFAKNNIYEQSI
jgi:YHS domain-containing protein